VLRAGFYDHYRAEHPVAGWTYDPARDFEAEYQNPDTQPAGRPTCKDWWAEPQIGLRKKVLDGSDPKWWERAWNFVSKKWNDIPEEKAADKASRW